MRKLLLFVFGLCLSVYLCASSDNETPNQDPINVELEKGNSNETKHPRTLIPITCVYADGTVQLTLLENFGEIGLFCN